MKIAMKIASAAILRAFTTRLLLCHVGFAQPPTADCSTTKNHRHADMKDNYPLVVRHQVNISARREPVKISGSDTV